MRTNRCQCNHINFKGTHTDRNPMIMKGGSHDLLGSLLSVRFFYFFFGLFYELPDMKSFCSPYVRCYFDVC